MTDDTHVVRFDKPKRPPKPPTSQQLRDQARRYVERYVPSVRQVERSLWRKVKKATGKLKDGSDAGPVIDAIIQDLAGRNILNDDRLARHLAAECQRRGDARSVIRNKLYKKLLPQESIRQALQELDDAIRDRGGDPKREQALAYARRRRLGPWRRDPDKRAARREKDLAAMGRAGISWGLAKEIVDCEDVELLEDELHART